MVTSKTLLAVILITALGCAGVRSASAAIIVINPSKDNRLYEYDPAEGDHSNGAGFHFFAGENGMGELRRGGVSIRHSRNYSSRLYDHSRKPVHEHVYDPRWRANRRAAQGACRLGRRDLPRAHGGS